MKASRVYKYRQNKNAWFISQSPKNENPTRFWGPNKGTYVRGIKKSVFKNLYNKLRG